MRTMISASKTVTIAACLFLVAACIEIHSYPGALHRAHAASSSLRSSAAGAHISLTRLVIGKRARPGSLPDGRHTGNELAAAATALPIHRLGFAELAQDQALSAKSHTERHPFSARPPPAS
jgi:hypothetical protein